MILAINENRKFQNQISSIDELAESVEDDEPLFDSSNYQKTDIRSNEIEKRTSFKDCTDVSFKEFLNVTTSDEEIGIRKKLIFLKC
jgi:hypothetical protein